MIFKFVRTTEILASIEFGIHGSYDLWKLRVTAPVRSVGTISAEPNFREV